MAKHHWQDRVTILIGIWIFISPWTIPYFFAEPELTRLGAWSHHLAGIGFFALSLSAIVAEQDWQEWMNCLVAVWLTISPWALSFVTETMFSLNAVIMGLIVLMLSAYLALTESMDAT